MPAIQPSKSSRVGLGVSPWSWLIVRSVLSDPGNPVLRTGAAKSGITAAEQHDVAKDEGIDGGAAGAEEAAMHVVPEKRLSSADDSPDERED